MLFNSYIFCLLFLPLCVTGYFCLNHLKKYNLSQAFLLGMSLWFYGYFNIKYLWIISFSVLFNFIIYSLLCKNKKKLILIIGLAVNIGLLLYFKYTDFFITSINKIFKSDFNLLNIALPLGISFFTFQQISFIIDTYKGEVANYNFINYASYVTFFPQLIAGPIVTHDELIPQFMDESKKKADWENIAKGIYIFTLGLAKKVLLADTFGNAVNWGYSNIRNLYSADAIIVILAYTFQIYFDFSGYCDMAIGIGKMMNIKLPVNFNSPYKARTITEFWDRWHITLTRFLTKYIYIPLGGNRKGELRTYINIFIVFFISGFWHGAGLSFIFWGVCHGVFSIITRILKNFFKKVPAVLNWIITFIFLNITWVFFRAPTSRYALDIILRTLNFRSAKIENDLMQNFNIPSIEIILQAVGLSNFSPKIGLFLLFILAFIIILCCKNSYEKMMDFEYTTKKTIFTAFLLFICIFQFSGISTFLYFNF